MPFYQQSSSTCNHTDSRNLVHLVKATESWHTHCELCNRLELRVSDILTPSSHIVGRGGTGELQVLHSLVRLYLPLGVVWHELEKESVDGVPRLDLHSHGDEEGDEKHNATGQRDYLLHCQLHLPGKMHNKLSFEKSAVRTSSITSNITCSHT